ncbi:uncharacterized protein LOC143371905 isoform X2 [Andrena cerasifolii]|uniref:uncharacterized protein LOC143371905 isoform X2 n=1 Tax=Andrena cerasifolii TaxID=2819439 RepID=UPI004037B2B0
MSGPKKCEVKGCESGNKLLRAFPDIVKDRERCLKWIAACGNPLLMHQSLCNRKICDAHFLGIYKLQKNLCKTAVPTLLLPGFNTVQQAAEHMEVHTGFNTVQQAAECMEVHTDTEYAVAGTSGLSLGTRKGNDTSAIGPSSPVITSSNIKIETCDDNGWNGGPIIADITSLNVKMESSDDASVAGPGSPVITSSTVKIESCYDDSAWTIEPGCAASTISDAENDSSSGSSSNAPTARKIRKRQPFLQVWLEDPHFKPWLQQADDPHKGKCTVCCRYVVAGKSHLQKHATSKVHNMNMQHREGPLASTVQPTRNFSENVKVAEIRFCIDMIEHNRSFNSFKQFVQMPQTPPLDANIVERISLKRSKITAIVQNVINKSIVLERTEILHGKLFSVLIEETTDVSDRKILWFLIRYFHKEQTYTYLLDLIRIKECTAENLYKCFLNTLKKYNLPVSNIVGVCADNTNVMLGRENSLISRLLADNEEISVFSCICHYMDLVASEACKHLPSHVEDFLHSILTYFVRSPIQQSLSESMQDFINFANQKVLHPSRARWLGLSESAERVLNQWPDLFAVLAQVVTEGKSKVASKILRNFNCPYTKAYVQFINYVLNIFTGINRLFQSSKVLIHCLLPESLRLVRLLGGNFIKSEYITAPNIHEIDVYNEANLLPMRTIYIGAEAMATINKITNSKLQDEKQIIQFYTNIKNFYQSAFKNIVKRLPFNEPFLNSLEFLSPHIALDITSHQNDQLNCILSKFKSKFNCNDVLNEWRLLPFYFSLEEKASLKILDIPEFWSQISNTNDISGKYMFKNISKLARLCLSLPHTNADVDRFLSIVTEIKTKERNKLKPQTVAALTRIKLDLTDKNVNSFDYKITDNMLNLFNSSMYGRERIPEELAGILLSDEADESDNETSDN